MAGVQMHVISFVPVGVESCDLAVYKMSGLSKSGRNCYMVACAMEKTCVTAEHHDFVANFILQGMSLKL